MPQLTVVAASSCRNGEVPSFEWWICSTNHYSGFYFPAPGMFSATLEQSLTRQNLRMTNNYVP